MIKPKLIVVLGMVVLLPVFACIAILLAPTTALIAIGNYYLSDSEISIVEAHAASVSPSTLSIRNMELQIGESTLDINELQLNYSIASLRAGIINRLEINTAIVKYAESQSDNETLQTNPLVLIQNTIDQFPVEHLVVNQFMAQYQGHKVDGFLSVDEAPFRATIQGSTTALPFQFDIIATEIAEDNITLDVKTAYDSQLLSQSNIEIEIENDKMLVAIQGQIQTSPALELSRSFFSLPSVNIAQPVIEIGSHFSVSFHEMEPSIVDMEILIDSPEHKFSIESQSLADASINLTLPTEMSASFAESYSIELQQLAGTIEMKSTDSGIFSSLQLTDANLSCTTIDSCSAQSTIQGEATYNPSTGSVGPIKFFSPFQVQWRDKALSIEGLDARFELETSTFDDNKISMDNGTANWSAVYSEGANFTAQMEVAASNVSLELLGLMPKNLEISNSITLANNEIHAVSHLRFNQFLDLESDLLYDINAQQGSVELAVPRLNFSKRATLSSLFKSVNYPIDIVDGSISADASFNFGFSHGNQFEMAGTGIVNLENLSGYYEDSAIARLSTKLEVEAPSFGHLKSSNPLHVSIDTLDVGLGLSDLSWQYEFDSTEHLISIADMSASVLQGRILIPQADINTNNLTNEVTVVIDSLDMAAITALANYPTVAVTGFISGYLPAVIENGSLSITQGLVSALNPGGSIKYTPVTVGPSRNSSIQLVNDALSNYQYETLDTDILYEKNGDLNLQVQLKGSNPDMNKGQQINLNVNISDNIPTLLRSLQASRAVTDALEKSLRAR